MGESSISVAILLSLSCEFAVGAIVGASIAKDRASGQRGMVIAMALALIVIVYGTVVSTLATQTLTGKVHILGIVGAVVSTLLLGFCPVLVCLLVSCAGYWSAFYVFRRLGIGPNRITLASVFAFVTILAGVTAIVTLRP